MADQDFVKLLFKKVKLNKTQPTEIDEILTTNNIDINITNSWNETLIYNCVKHAVNIKLLEWLYLKGCDPRIVNKKGYNAFNACLQWNHKRNNDIVLDWLQTKKIQFVKEYPNLPFFHNIMICYRHIDIYNWALANYDINERDDNGNTALHISCDQSTEHNLMVGCRWLCEVAKCNVNITNNMGETALHLAATSAFSNCLKMLLRHNADTTIINADGATAYDKLLVNKDNIINNKWQGDFQESIQVFNQYVQI